MNFEYPSAFYVPRPLGPRPEEPHSECRKRGQSDISPTPKLSLPGLPRPYPLIPSFVPPGPPGNASQLFGPFSSKNERPFPVSASFDGVSSFEHTSPEHVPSAMSTTPREPAQSPTPGQIPENANTGANTSSLQSPPENRSPSRETNQPTTRPASASTSTRTRETLTVRFADVAAHTAKCDECDKRNRDGMSRCLACGWQCCRKCLSARASDRTHRSFTSTHAPENIRSNNTPRPNAGGGAAAAAGDSRPSTSGQEAAETLLGISGDNTPTGRESSNHGLGMSASATVVDGQDGMDREGSEGLALMTDDDETLTWLSKSEDENGDLPESALEDMGLVRRNPPRASRPFGMAE